MKDYEIYCEIIEKYGTPLFVFDEDELTERTEKIKDILGDISLCYSIKANPFLINALTDIVDYFEVCSPGELAICKTLNVPPAKIIYSGVQKGAEDIRDAVLYGCNILTAESVRHYELICSAANEFDTKVTVILRLTPGNQFGMSLDDIEDILKKPNPLVNITGLHYFAGTGRKKLSKQREELENLTVLINDLRKRYGMEFPMLEYGPGLPFPYFTDDDFSDTLAPLKELIPDLKNAAESCTLSVEMGRFLASSCGYYVTRICDIKKSGNNYCIIDGGINHINYLGQMMGMKVPLTEHLRKDGTFIEDSAHSVPGDDYTVCGSLCTTNDVIVRSLSLTDAKIGDILVFSNIGAYSVTEAMGLFLSRTLPRVVTVKDSKYRLVRDRTESWKINIGYN